jgi:endonuclease/exonuclease/phosphatase family metal-dependent hydrolase
VKPSFGFRGWLRRALALSAFAYLATLLLLWFGFYWLGESWWVTAAGLYAPRVFFAAPLPVLSLLLWVCGLRRLLWTQLASAFVLIVPLMGLVVSLPSAARAGAPSLRVLSFNVNSGYAGPQAIADAIFAQAPDVVMLQESPWAGDLADALHVRYPVVQRSTQFIIASRYPISEATDPERLPFYGRARSPRFMRYVIDTPLGKIAVYNVHPISPRGVLHIRQFRAALHQLRTGELFAGDPEADMKSNAGLRTLQIATVAGDAARERLPVLLAGDTNLPGLSAVYRKHLASYKDGFREAGFGFGYTFPWGRAFLRLDRILGSDTLRFTSFRVGCEGLSDHLCVVADIQTVK